MIISRWWGRCEGGDRGKKWDESHLRPAPILPDLLPPTHHNLRFLLLTEPFQ